jgi:hypothetical protein
VVHWADDLLSVPESVLEDPDTWECLEVAIISARNFGQVFSTNTLRFAPYPLSSGDRNTIVVQLSFLRAALFSHIDQQFPMLLLDIADRDQAPNRLEQWQKQLQSYCNDLIQQLLTALPNDRGKVIATSMFKIAMHRITKGKTI